MDEFHKKRLIVLTSVTLTVVVLAVAGLFMLNNEMGKALTQAQHNMGLTETSENPQTEDSEMKVEW